MDFASFFPFFICDVLMSKKTMQLSVALSCQYSVLSIWSIFTLWLWFWNKLAASLLAVRRACTLQN